MIRCTLHQGGGCGDGCGCDGRNGAPPLSKADRRHRWLLKAAGAVGLQGHGKLLSGNRGEFTNKDGKTEELKARNRARRRLHTTELKSLPFDGKDVVDSWGALEFDAVQKRLG